MDDREPEDANREPAGGRLAGAFDAPSARQKREAALAHGAGLLVFFFPLGNVAGPLFVLLTAGKRSAFVAVHARQAVLVQALVSLLVWTLFFSSLVHGTGRDLHLAVRLLSVPLLLLAVFLALRGRARAYPLPLRWSDPRRG